MNDAEIFSKNWSILELVKMRADALLEVKPHGHDSFTCDTCVHRPVCIFVYDPYNTEGDCLAAK